MGNACLQQKFLFRKRRIHQRDKAVNGSLLVDAVRDDADGGITDDTERQNTQETLRIDGFSLYFYYSTSNGVVN